MGRRRTRKPQSEPEAPVTPEEPEAPTEEPEAPAADEPEPEASEPVEEAEPEAPEAPGADEPESEPESEPEPDPLPTKCPDCGAELRVIASKGPETYKDEYGNVQVRQVEVGYCAACGAEVARGTQVARHVSRVGIGDAAKAFHGLRAEDMVPYLPSPGAGGVKITSGGRGVRLYTLKRGTLVYRIGMKQTQ